MNNKANQLIQSTMKTLLTIIFTIYLLSPTLSLSIDPTIKQATDQPTIARITQPTTPIIEYGEFTAYTASANECDDDPTITASNKKIYSGAIACPSRYPFGTRIRVNNIIYTCEDRMNQRYRNSNYFDIYIETRSEALAFGRKSLAFEVLE